MKEDKRKVLEEAVERLNDQGYEARIYHDYSGRSMFGATTDGIVTSASGVIVGAYIALAALDICKAAGDPDEADALIEECILERCDSLAMDTIYY